MFTPLSWTNRCQHQWWARATISLFDFDSDDRSGFPALDTNGKVTTPIVGQVKLVPNPWPEAQPAHQAIVNFADTIRLVGYDLSTEDEGIMLTLYWEPVSAPPEDYTLFIHLLDADGNLVGQADRPPTAGAYPTRWWVPGEHISDQHTMEATSGASRLKLGLYSPQSGQRLPVIDSSLPIQDNGVMIELGQ
jgi:hypothetical protein